MPSLRGREVMMATIVVIDARSRERNCFVASATKLQKNSAGLVLRKAGGNIGTVEKLHGQTVEHPILVVGSYQAQSSAGYTSRLHSSDGVFCEAVWVGGAGFGFSSEDEETGKKVHRGYGLRPFGHPLVGTLIPAGARVEKVETHRNSNPATANAALSALGLMVQMNPNLFLLAEGQSDYTSATSFEVAEDSARPVFGDEHRAEDIFSSEKILEAGIRRMVGPEEGREGRIALSYALLNTVIAVGKSAIEANSFTATVPEVVCDFLGNEEIERIVEKRYVEFIGDGWTFGFDTEMLPHPTIRSSSPTGKVAEGPSLASSPEVEEMFLVLSSLNTKEEKREMRVFKISENLKFHFWNNWGQKKGEGLTSMYDHDMLVQAELRDERSSVESLWFSNSDKLGPNGEPNSGSRYLSAFDTKGRHLWNYLLEVKKITITAYGRDGREVNRRVWINDALV